MVQVKLFSVLVLCFSLSVHGIILRSNMFELTYYSKYVVENGEDGFSPYGAAYSKIDCTGNVISSSFTNTSQECVDLCNESGLPCTAVRYKSETNRCDLLSEYNCENKYSIYDMRFELGSYPRFDLGNIYGSSNFYKWHNKTFHEAYCEDEKRSACGFYETLSGIPHILYINETGEREYTSRGPGYSKIDCTGTMLSSFSSFTDTSLKCRNLCLVQNANVTHNNATGLPCTAVKYFSESNECQLLSEYNCEEKYTIYESSATVSNEAFHNAYCEGQKRATCGRYIWYYKPLDEEEFFSYYCTKEENFDSLLC